MNDQNRLEKIADDNDRSLKTLARSLALSQGRFSLILVRCNYGSLRSQILQRLRQECNREIPELILAPSSTTLYTEILERFDSQPLEGLMVLGLESVVALDDLLIATNRVRDRFLSLKFPLVLWVTDGVLRKLVRVAPDFLNWMSPPLKFILPNNELMVLLQANVVCAFIDEPIFTLDAAELKTIQDDLRNQGEELVPEIKAVLGLILGLSKFRENRLDEAIAEYRESLAFWQETNQFYRSGVVLLNIAWAYYRKGKEYKTETRDNIQECLKQFEQVNSPELLAKHSSKIGELLRHLEEWQKLQSLAEKVLTQHQSQGEARLVVQDYSFLAEVALKQERWQDGNQRAQEALDILNNGPDSDPKILGRCYFILAKSQGQLGQIEKGIKNLETAKNIVKISSANRDWYDPILYVDILAELRRLRFEKGDYLEAFHRKLEQREIEIQYGLRAFIGAGRLLPYRHISGDRKSVNIEDIVKEFGREKDVKELVERVKNRRDRKLTIIYGSSGVGKSSILQAALIPVLEDTYFEGRDILPIFVQVYQDWVGKVLGANRANPSPNPSPKRRGELELGSPNPSPNPSPKRRGELELGFPFPFPKRRGELELGFPFPFPKRRGELDFADSGSPFPCREGGWGVRFSPSQEILEKLRQNEDDNLLTVLIFDQFEEFFFDNPSPSSRREFYDFLRDCLEIPYLKVILSLREDYLYYLLEFSRTTDLANLDTNYQHILYYLGNFSTQDAQDIMEGLTNRSQFTLESDLVAELVKDLAGELGEIRPIELQVVGAQLETEKITTLKQYREVGSNPKQKLVERFLEVVVEDCGKENERVAKLVLYWLTNENNTRLRKTQVELAEDLEGDAKKLDLVLEILVGSGLLLRVPGVPNQYYQLVHDYLVSFIRQKYQAQSLELAEERERSRKFQKWVLFGSVVAAVMMTGLAITAGISGWQANQQRLEAEKQRQEAEKQSIIAQFNLSQALFLSDKQLEALMVAVKAGKQVQNSKLRQPDAEDLVVNVLVNWVYNLRQYNRLEQHKSPVNSVSFSPDGQMIASASDDETVKLWKKGGTIITTLTGHSGWVNSVSFSPDGEMIASASDDKTVKLWQKDGKLIGTLTGHSNRVKSINFSLDGETIASASTDKTVKLWKKDGTLIATLKGHKNSVRSVSFSPDGKTIASASTDKTVKLWKKDGTLITTFTGHGYAINSVSFSPDGETIASASTDKTVKLWKKNGTLITILTGHGNAVNSVSFSPDGETIASADDDGIVKLWTKQGNRILSLIGHINAVHSITFSPDGQIIASASMDKTVKLWKKDSIPAFTMNGHSKRVNSVNFSSNNEMIASASDDKTVKLWKKDGTLIKTIDGHTEEVNSVTFSPDGKTIASASTDNTVKLWKKDGTLIKTLTEHKDWVSSVSFSPDGETIASASGDNTVKLWKKDGTFIKTLTGHNDAVYSVIFSPDGETIASASGDNTVKLWTKDGIFIKPLSGHIDRVYSVIFSPDGKLIASASADNTVKLWKRDGTLITTLTGHIGAVNSVSFSPNGKTIASGSWDNTVKLWKINGTIITTMTGYDDWVNSISFSPNGKVIASASSDYKVKLWTLKLDDNLDSFLRRSCDLLNDYLQNTSVNMSEEDRHICDGINAQKSHN